jgi:hypothetical protein
MPHYGYGNVGFGQAETVQTLAAGSVILIPTGGEVMPIGWQGTAYTVDAPLKAVTTADETVTSLSGRMVLLPDSATVQNSRAVTVLDPSKGDGSSVVLPANTRFRVATAEVEVFRAQSGSTWTEVPAEPVVYVPLTEEGCPEGSTLIKGRCVETIIVPPPPECPEGQIRNAIGDCEAPADVVPDECPDGQIRNATGECEDISDDATVKPWYKTTAFYVTTAVGGALALGTVLWAALRRKG